MAWIFRGIMPVCVTAVLLTAGCGGSGNMVVGPNPQSSVTPVGSAPAPAGPQAQRAAGKSRLSAHSLADVRSWTEPATLAATPSAALAALTALPESLLILDPAQVAAMKTDHPLAAIRQKSSRRLLAVLDIGEIAKTNPRWEPAWVDGKGKPTSAAPAWLGPADPNVPGQYDVQYWNPDWQKQAAAALNQIVASGYNGVCLQGVSAYQSFLKRRPTAAADMAAFVEALAAQGRKTDPAFTVLPDGGVGLPSALPSVQAQAYLDSVDGILARNVFYPGDKPTDNALAPDTTVLAALAAFQKAGKPVFVTERLTDPDLIADFLTRARSEGFIPDSALTPPPTVPAQVADAH